MHFGKLLRQIQPFVARQSKQGRRILKLQRLKNALADGQRLVIDFGMDQNRMTEMDRRRLVLQTKLLYESNMNSSRPFALTFAELRKESNIFTSFKEAFPAFEDMVVHISEQQISEIFSNSNDLIYLTPDSTEALQEMDTKKVYILGGLVDYQVTKNVTQRKATQLNIETRRLPIVEYMSRKEGKYSYSKILTINQVFNILMTYQETRDWRVALSIGIPARKGYIPKPDL